jgi:hypothetical protein
MIVVKDMKVETVKVAIAELIEDDCLKDACAYIGNVNEVFTKYPPNDNLL